jgi:hypothetical protein
MANGIPTWYARGFTSGQRRRAAFDAPLRALDISLP